MKVYTCFNKIKQNKKLIKEELRCRYVFFLNAAVLSRKTKLVKANYLDLVLAFTKY